MTSEKQDSIRPRSIAIGAIIYCRSGGSISAASRGAQERLLPTSAAAVSDPVGQSSQRGPTIVGSDAAVDEPLVPVLPVAIPPPDGAVVVVAAAPVPSVAAAPIVSVAARIVDGDVAAAGLENVGPGMFVPATPKLVDVATGGVVVVELDDIDELVCPKRQCNWDAIGRRKISAFAEFTKIDR